MAFNILDDDQQWLKAHEHELRVWDYFSTTPIPSYDISLADIKKPMKETEHQIIVCQHQ